MNSLKTQPPKDYERALVSLMARLSHARQEQVYEFALFLSGRSQEAEETSEAIEADEKEWDAQFASANLDVLDTLIAGVEADIAAGRTKPMFNAQGDFVER